MWCFRVNSRERSADPLVGQSGSLGTQKETSEIAHGAFFIQL